MSGTGWHARLGASPDVLVVGAGIVGAACARVLAREGLRVLIVDAAAGPGAFPGATGAGMGHVLVVDDDPHLLALTHYGRELWHGLAPRLPAAAQWHLAGTLWLAEDTVDMALARKKARMLHHAGITAHVVPAEDLRRLEPSLAADLAGGLRVPGDAIIYPPVAAHWLLQQAEHHGARTRFGTLVARVAAGGVQLCDGSYLAAGKVVCAAGIAALELLAPDLLPIPLAARLQPRKGHLLITDPAHRPDPRGGAQPLCRHQLVELGYQKSAHGDAARSVAFNLQPRPGGQLLVGSSRQYGELTSAIDRVLVAEMLHRAVRFVPALADALALRVWTGMRPATAHKLPLIGPLPDCPTVFLGAGHEGLGITTALATAELLRDQILHRRTALDASPFLPRTIEEVRASA